MPISSFKYENMFTKAMLCGLELYSHWVPLVEVFSRQSLNLPSKMLPRYVIACILVFFRSSSRSISTMAVLRA